MGGAIGYALYALGAGASRVSEVNDTVTQPLVLANALRSSVADEASTSMIVVNDAQGRPSPTGPIAPEVMQLQRAQAEKDGRDVLDLANRVSQTTQSDEVRALAG